MANFPINILRSLPIFLCHNLNIELSGVDNYIIKMPFKKIK